MARDSNLYKGFTRGSGVSPIPHNAEENEPSRKRTREGAGSYRELLRALGVMAIPVALFLLAGFRA